MKAVSILMKNFCIENCRTIFLGEGPVAFIFWTYEDIKITTLLFASGFNCRTGAAR